MCAPHETVTMIRETPSLLTPSAGPRGPWRPPQGAALHRRLSFTLRLGRCPSLRARHRACGPVEPFAVLGQLGLLQIFATSSKAATNMRVHIFVGTDLPLLGEKCPGACGWARQRTGGHTPHFSHNWPGLHSHQPRRAPGAPELVVHAGIVLCS